MIFCETALRAGPIRPYSYPATDLSSEIRGYAGDEGAEGASRRNMRQMVQTEDHVGQCNLECERNQKPNELRIMGWSNGRPTMRDDHVQNSPNCGIAVIDRQRHHQDIPKYALAKPAHDEESWRTGSSQAAR